MRRPTPRRPTQKSLVLLLGSLGLLLASGGCSSEPTAVALQIQPPAPDVRLTALFVVLIDEQAQNQAQVVPFLNLKDLEPPYTLNISPPEGQDLSQLTVQARVFGYYDNGRSTSPLTTFSRLDRFQFLPGIQNRSVQLDRLILNCGFDEGNALGCLCFLYLDDTHQLDYACGAGQQCVKQTDFDSGLPGGTSDLRVCLGNEACPPGTVGCPCKGGGLSARCDGPLECVDGTCAPCKEVGCGCIDDSACAPGLVCGAAHCCDPASGCACYSQRECESAYPGEGRDCVNGACQPPQCSITDTFLMACESDGECCGTPCFGGSCCNPIVQNECVCQSDADCAKSYPPGFRCQAGTCLGPRDCADPDGDGNCCSVSSDCLGPSDACLAEKCCDVASGGCPCQEDTDCLTPEGLQLSCINSACAPREGKQCEGDSGRTVTCACDTSEQCNSGICCSVRQVIASRCVADPTDCIDEGPL